MAADDGSRLRIDPPSPGSMTEVDVDGTPVTIANIDGSLHAFESTCTHRGCSLAEGTLEGMTVVCSCHGGTYDLRTGEVLDGPPQGPIRIRPIAVDGDSLVIGG